MIEKSKGHDFLSQATIGELTAQSSLGKGKSTDQVDTEILSNVAKALEAGLSTPEEADAHYLSGGVLLRRNRLPEAKAEITEALQLYPKMANSLLLMSAWKDLSLIAQLQGDPRQELNCLEEAITMVEQLYGAEEDVSPVLAELHEQLAYVYIGHRKDFTDAISQAQANAEKAIQLVPQRPAPYFALGAIFEAREPLTPQDKASATLNYNKYVELIGTPSNERDLGRLKTAKSALQYLREASPNQGQEKGGCYVATAIYGNVDHPDVRLLREYRDRVLLKSAQGRAFVRFYYAASPTLVAMVRWNMQELLSGAC